MSLKPKLRACVGAQGVERPCGRSASLLANPLLPAVCVNRRHSRPPLNTAAATLARVSKSSAVSQKKKIHMKKTQQGARTPLHLADGM